MSLVLTSSAFAANGAIPALHTCEGQDVSPALSWQGAPPGTKSFALIVDDPDAPSGTFTHWVVVGIDPHSDGVDPGERPPGGTELVNGFGKPGWGGPHPPPGDEAHHYVFRLYALSEPCVLPDAPSSEQVHRVVEDRQIASGTLVGLYQR